jgi:hypothetical protein
MTATAAPMSGTGLAIAQTSTVVIAGRDPGQPLVALRVYLNPHVDLELTEETAPGLRSG